MKKFLLFICVLFIGNSLFAQIQDIVQQTWYLRNIQINDTWHYVPDGEAIELNFGGNNPNYTVSTNGVENTFTANATFNNDQIAFTSIAVSSTVCTAANCDFEDLYFYELLSNQNLDDKTFTYYYQVISNGRKTFRITDANGNRATFTDQPLEEIDEVLFQTWYLHYMEFDLGDTVFISEYTPSISPSITINPDLSFTGFGSCNEFMGNFNFTESPSNGTMLIPNNFDATLTLCDFHIDFENYYFSQFENDGILYFLVAEDPSTEEGYFIFEKAPGFLFHFYNYPLSVPDIEKNSFSIYPNPTQDKLFVKSTIPISSSSITDLNGRNIISNENPSSEIDVSGLKAGMYFLTLESSEGNTTRKFIKY
ncbi:T9SS type A sorting domain-containing protein [Aequorivita sp. SDUM287046]|uniref:T9SS type A sorting domain-containing protein n=1 Tax=Aequorivita aurantiaca TaxID=3053356 RepID=A0ABT8DGY4_9FLAO|nr:T9SS type A sorting domain-containing protein [Aequorivita aurantiaca]MDN3723201.1 T9SS type A sorting domain-containing protein [Aequorivita aurantiaca]